MRLFKCYYFYYNKKYSMEDIFSQLDNVNEFIDNCERIEFFINDVQSHKTSGIDRIVKAYPELNQYKYQYKDDYLTYSPPNSTPKDYINALSNLDSEWKNYNPNLTEKFRNIETLKNVFNGIPRRFPVYKAVINFRMINWDSFTKSCKNESIEEKLYFSNFFESSITIFNNWDYPKRERLIRLCIEIDPEYIEQNNSLFDPKLETKIKSIKGSRVEGFKVINTEQESENIINKKKYLLDTYANEISIITRNINQISITESSSTIDYNYPAKDLLKKYMGKLGFTYNSKNSRKDNYSFYKRTKRNNVENLNLLLTVQGNHNYP